MQNQETEVESLGASFCPGGEYIASLIYDEGEGRMVRLSPYACSVCGGLTGIGQDSCQPRSWYSASEWASLDRGTRRAVQRLRR